MRQVGLSNRFDINRDAITVVPVYRARATWRWKDQFERRSLNKLIEQRSGCGDSGDSSYRCDPRTVLGNMNGVGYVHIVDDGYGMVIGSVHLGADDDCKYASGDERCSHGCRSEIVVVRLKVVFNIQ